MSPRAVSLSASSAFTLRDAMPTSTAFAARPSNALDDPWALAVAASVRPPASQVSTVSSAAGVVVFTSAQPRSLKYAVTRAGPSFAPMVFEPPNRNAGSPPPAAVTLFGLAIPGASPGSPRCAQLRTASPPATSASTTPAPARRAVPPRAGAWPALVVASTNPLPHSGQTKSCPGFVVMSSCLSARLQLPMLTHLP